MNYKLMVVCGLVFVSLNLIAWGKNGSPIATGPGDQVWPDACWDGENFWVVWQNNVDSTIYGARVSAAGELLDPNPVQYPHLSGYTHYWPSVAFGDTILCVAFQSLKYDTFMLADIAKVVSVRFRPDGSIMDTKPCFFGGSSFLCPPTQSPKLFSGKTILFVSLPLQYLKCNLKNIEPFMSSPRMKTPRW